MISYLCKVAGISRSGYYNYFSATSQKIRKRKNKRDELLKINILKAFNFKNRKKGARQIKMTLEEHFDIVYNLKRIRRIMKKYDIICTIRRANPYRRIMKATQEHSVTPNLLNRNFKQNIPGKVLLTDTLHKLVKNSIIQLSPDAFIHSDQGTHYTSPIFQKLFKSYGISQSMSRRGNCWDNAPHSSFFGHLKDECTIKTCQTFEQLQEEIDDYMIYYNQYRCQWGLKKMTPVKYRNHLCNTL